MWQQIVSGVIGRVIWELRGESLVTEMTALGKAYRTVG